MDVIVWEIKSTIRPDCPLVGEPVVKIRLYGEEVLDESDSRHPCKMEYEKMVGMIRNMLCGNGTIVVVGREPLLQKDVVLRLADEFLGSVVLETCGRIPLEYSESSLFKLIVVTPELDDNWDIERWVMILRRWEYVKDWKGNVVYRFVVGENSWKLDDVKFVVEEVGIPKSSVWVVPEMHSLRLCREIWNFCIENGFNYGGKVYFE